MILFVTFVVNMHLIKKVAPSLVNLPSVVIEVWENTVDTKKEEEILDSCSS